MSRGMKSAFAAFLSTLLCGVFLASFEIEASAQTWRDTGYGDYQCPRCHKFTPYTPTSKPSRCRACGYSGPPFGPEPSQTSYSDSTSCDDESQRQDGFANMKAWDEILEAAKKRESDAQALLDKCVASAAQKERDLADMKRRNANCDATPPGYYENWRKFKEAEERMKIQTQRMNLLATILNSLSVDREALAQLGTAPKFKTDPFLDDSALYAKVDIGAFVTDGLYKKALRDRETIKATIAELDKQAEFLSSHEAGKERELAEQARLKRVEMLKLGNKALDIALPKITEWIDNYLDDAAEGKEPPTPLMELRRDVNSLKDALDDEQTVSFESRKRILQEANKLGKVSLQPFASKMGAAKVEKLKAAANALVKTSIMLMEPPKSQDETKEFDEFRNSIGTLLDIAGELGPQVKGASLLYDATRKYEEIAKINGTLASLKRIKGQNLDAQGRIAERRLQAQRDLESVERTIAMYEASRGNGGGPK